MKVPLEAPVSPAPPSPWWLIFAIFLVAAVPRLAGIGSGIIEVAPDTGTYAMPAKNLLAGQGYTDDSGRPYSFRPPTYPLFLAAVFGVAGESLLAVKVVQALLAAAGASALTLWLWRRLGPSGGLGAGLLLALDPILIPVPAFVLTEALGTLLVIGVVLALEDGLRTRRSTSFLLAGGLGGAAALNTPITLLLVPWLLLTAWILRSPRRPGWRAWTFAVGLTLACVGAWTGRNYMVQGDAVVVRANGFGSLVWATTEYEFDWLPSPYEASWQDLRRKYDTLYEGRTDSEAHRVFLREAWRNFTERPLVVIKRVAKANFWFWIEAPGSHVSGDLRPIRLLTLVYHQFQLVAFAVGCWALWRAGRLREWALWLSTILYFGLFLSLMMPIPRYYVPVLPVVDTLIAVGLALVGPRARPSSAAPVFDRRAGDAPLAGAGRRR